VAPNDGAHANAAGMNAGLSYISLASALVASLAATGCASGGMPPALHLAASAQVAPIALGARADAALGSLAARRAAVTARGASPSAIKSAARETTSPLTEGAAFFTLHAADARGENEVVIAPQRCPAEMTLVDGRSCVDRWEASLVERVPGGVERAWSPYLPVDGHEHWIRAVSRPGVIPQGYISGKQAQAACNASGKRLCTSGEWEHACRGPTTTQFPYGPARRAGACNDDSRSMHPVAEVGLMLGLPRNDFWREGMNQPLINQLPDTLLATGERAECTNEYGVFDMVGNLHEWIDDSDGTFRGGYYMDTSHNGEGCAYATAAHDFSYHDYSTGFRCCADPERIE
jgi:formylglycine-generating enzyme